MKFISIPLDSAEEMARQHKFLKNMHEEMSKSLFDQMREHISAAQYHEQQAEKLEKAVKDVTFMLETSTRGVGGSDSGSTAETTSTATPTADSTHGPSDPVKKADLMNVLKAHAEEYGDFDMDIESIANFLLAK